jgi:hypothetical protein
MLTIFIILIFILSHILFYRFLKINLINISFIFFINLFLIVFFYSFELSFIFLILLTFNSFIFCYSIFFTGITDDSPTLKIIYYLYFLKIKDKKNLEKKFINSDTIESRINNLLQNKFFFLKKKKKYNLTRFSQKIMLLIIFIEKTLKLKSDV